MEQILIMLFAQRIKAEQMILEQVPIIYREAVEKAVTDNGQ